MVFISSKQYLRFLETIKNIMRQIPESYKGESIEFDTAVKMSDNVYGMLMPQKLCVSIQSRPCYKPLCLGGGCGKNVFYVTHVRPVHCEACISSYNLNLTDVVI